MIVLTLIFAICSGVAYRSGLEVHGASWAGTQEYWEGKILGHSSFCLISYRRYSLHLLKTK